jgi:hypothetical protein
MSTEKLQHQLRIMILSMREKSFMAIAETEGRTKAQRVSP